MKMVYCLLAIMASSPAWAGDACNCTGAPRNDYEIAKQAYQAADQELNTTYQAALRSIESSISDDRQRQDTRDRLKDAQRLWISYRDVDCDAVQSMWRNEPFADYMHLQCETKHTQQRTKEIDTAYIIHG
ncbi:lysozyme inhibitor LprI family protein [Jeongeupia wiesaeckerbachi]|uniref:lysozyme inhibitor LprI family protein n=1 Tax=Jeongeupia wiesaeckerbachi TaxID=3051218 RepID=UPI003D806250